VPDKRKVLVVEDQETLGDNLREYLCRRGWQAVLARDGRTAVELSAEFGPSVILMDYELPDMDGFQTISAIRAAHDCSCVLMTAHSGASVVQRAPQYGIAHVLHKPFPLAEMEERLRAQCAQSTGVPASH
jgi:DNA-binding response OmpR family regulator